MVGRRIRGRMLEYLTILPDVYTGLTTLRFAVELKVEDRDLDIGRALGDIEATLSGLNLIYLDIVVDDAGLPEEALDGASLRSADGSDPLDGSQVPVAPNQDGAAVSGESAGSRASLYPAERSLDKFDVQAFAARLARSIPTLQDGIISIRRPCRCGFALKVSKLLRDEVLPLGLGGQIVYEEISAEQELAEPFWFETVFSQNADS